MQSATEVGAIEWNNTNAVWNPLQCACFTRHYENLSIGIALYSKSVRNIPFLLQIGNMEINLIANLYTFDVVWNKSRTYSAKININTLSITFNTSFFRRAYHRRVVVV